MKKKITVVAFVTINSLFLFYYQGKNTVKYNENKQIYNINFGWFADNDKYVFAANDISNQLKINVDDLGSSPFIETFNEICK